MGGRAAADHHDHDHDHHRRPSTATTAPHRDSQAEPAVRPMLATAAAALPTGPGWSYEMKWDGIRALLVVERRGAAGVLPDRARRDRRGTRSWPVSADALRSGATRCSTARSWCSTRAAGRASRRSSVTSGPRPLFLFDLLELDGESLVDLDQQSERRAPARGAGDLNGPNWQTPPTSADGPAAFATASGSVSKASSPSASTPAISPGDGARRGRR